LEARVAATDQSKMSRPSTLGSDAEMQLAELQRKYRIMEGNRKSYSEDSQKTIV